MNAASSPRGSPRIKKKVQGQGQGHQDKRPYCLMKYRFNLPFLALGAIVVGTCVAAFTASPKLNLATSTFIQRGRAGQSSSVGTQLQLAVPHARSRADKTLTSLSMSEPEGGEGDDLADWKALVAAFKMYKAAYGDLRVPLRFIVPSMPPWPSKCPSSQNAVPVHAVAAQTRTNLIFITQTIHRKRLGHETRSPSGSNSLDWTVCSKRREPTAAIGGNGIRVAPSNRLTRQVHERDHL